MANWKPESALNWVFQLRTTSLLSSICTHFRLPSLLTPRTRCLATSITDYLMQQQGSSCFRTEWATCKSIRRSVQRHVEAAHSALAVRKSVSEGGLQPAFLVLRRSEDVFVELRSVALKVAESGNGVLRVDESRFTQLERTQVTFRVANQARKSS